ncbi:MAG: Uma2 family endonuclease [Synechococcaceae cyanobacterium SM2_3_1]|nr:Uma2 family endonuclease [Synechococcaceae cyanobacterium SM2_3_1]
MDITKKQHYSPEEYLALDDAAENKNEYIMGKIIAMTGATTNHNRIARNLSAWLHFASKDGDEYENFIGDVKLWIPEEQAYTYPNVMVVAGAVEYHQNRTDIICNPRVIIEVLSQSTEYYDRLEKFSLYRTIPSLEEYVLISQIRFHVEHDSKRAVKQWNLQDLDSEDIQLPLTSIPFTIPLEDLYRKVQFSEVDREANPESALTDF